MSIGYLIQPRTRISHVIEIRYGVAVHEMKRMHVK